MAKSKSSNLSLLPPGKWPEGENPVVVTRSLYVAGHRLGGGRNVCPNYGRGLRMLILVTTAPGHLEQREAVRGTWGKIALRRDIGFAFFVGMATSPKENQLVELENQIYGDIIQVRFSSICLDLC